jgi:predicted DsbA family dithiol-disulfide isomerase
VEIERTRRSPLQRTSIHATITDSAAVAATRQWCDNIMSFRIEVISDVVCPWCFIGKRRLEQALQTLSADGVDAGDIQVVWHPFQLNPQLPQEGMPRAEYVAAKFGGRSAQIYERVTGVGRSVGIDFAFERIVQQPNTLAAHQLIELARSAGVQDQMVETLFRAYFLEGKDLTQRPILVELARAAGLDPVLAGASLNDDLQRQAIVQQDEDARALGVTGVPFFVFGGQLAVSGAQEPAVLVRAFKEAVQAVSA